MNKTLDIFPKGDDLTAADALPLRQDVPGEGVTAPPKKDIHKTTGGKIADFFIYQVLGFGANSALSVGFTYGVNPREGTKKFRAALNNGAQKAFGGFLPPAAIGNAVDIFYMLFAGTALTAAMAPLVNRRDKIAHWINQKLGKDADVLPDSMRPAEEPKTLEDKIELELKKRVNYGQTSGDLWKARWSAILVPLFGDSLLGKWSESRETRGKMSVDSASWRAGQHIHDKILPPDKVDAVSRFFTNHGAGIADMEKNNKQIFDRLSVVENQHDVNNQKLGKPAASPHMRDNRMMVADQTRLLGKEVGWTLILAQIVERLTCTYQKRRVAKQENVALKQLYAEGVIPEGIKVASNKDGTVQLVTTKEYEAAHAKPEDSLLTKADQRDYDHAMNLATGKAQPGSHAARTGREQKAGSFTAAIDKARAAQPEGQGIGA